MEIAERCLEVVRGSVEAAAARERDEAAARLLSELELEDASKKVAYPLRLCLLGIFPLDMPRLQCLYSGQPKHSLISGAVKRF